jgi:hypothetical protein
VKACADYLDHLLRQAGLEVELDEFAPGRPSLVARRHGQLSVRPRLVPGKPSNTTRLNQTPQLVGRYPLFAEA